LTSRNRCGASRAMNNLSDNPIAERLRHWDFRARFRTD
jgi:hypothetical protein